MFNQNDYRMAKVQQERLLADAEKQDGRAQRSNFFVALLRKLAARGEKKAQVQAGHKPVGRKRAQAKA